MVDKSKREGEVAEVIRQLEKEGMNPRDISNDELTKAHGRYLVGGRQIVEYERVFRFGKCGRSNVQAVLHTVITEFPERPGALRRFLHELRSDWNISLFHYRNHGAGMSSYSDKPVMAISHSIADVGKVLAGVQVPPEDRDAFETFLQRLGYQYIEETDNEVYRQYLRR